MARRERRNQVLVEHMVLFFVSIFISSGSGGCYASTYCMLCQCSFVVHAHANPQCNFIKLCYIEAGRSRTLEVINAILLRTDILKQLLCMTALLQSLKMYCSGTQLSKED